MVPPSNMTATELGIESCGCAASATCEKPEFTYKRRLLYDVSTRSLPDNHVDKSFLNGLQKNVNMKKYDLNDAIIHSCVVNQEVNSVCGCVMAFVYLDNQWLSQSELLVVSSLLVVFCYIIFEAQLSLHRWYSDIKTALVFLAFVLGLSPVLKTLTHTVSTDSIYSMTAMLMIVHLVTYDYGLSANIVKPSLSLTAAIAASVTLASRLSTVFYVFEFLIFAIEVFALFPILRRKIQMRWSQTRLPLTIFLGLLCCFSVGTTSRGYALALCTVQVVINLVCPVMFIRWQKHKQNIYGPWDEATIPD